ncbi:hypothetical protein ckin120_06300 [Helicobacter pylori]
MEIQQTHRKMNRPLVSLVLAGALVSAIPQESHAAFFTTVIIPAIVGGIATGTAVGTVSGLLSWGLKQAEEANKTPDKPDKVWRIQAGKGFNEFPNKDTTYTNPFYPARLMEVGTGGTPLGIIGSKAGNGTSLKWI